MGPRVLPTWLLLLLSTSGSVGVAAGGTGSLHLPSPIRSTCYQPGEKVDPATYVYDSGLQRRNLVDLLKADTAEVVVLVLFGGGAVKTPTDKPFRGPLWCQDSFDDLAVQRALVGRFAGEPVRFLAVAVSPVLNPEQYGYPEGVFLAESEESEAFRIAAGDLIEATRRHQQSGLIPFSELYYDPAFRLLYDPDLMAGMAAGRPAFAWEGRLKACSDARRYGVPTIWLLARDGTLLAEPFPGNDYGSQPPEIHYGFKELEAAVERALGRQPGPK